MTIASSKVIWNSFISLPESYQFSMLRINIFR